MKSNIKTSRLLFGMSVICVLAVIGMVIALCVPKEERVDFIKPPFEASAVEGLPDVPEAAGYHKISADGMPFSAYLCGNVTINANLITVYFTNPAENSVWLKLRILDENGVILGESGILRPNEYVESIMLSASLPDNTPIKMKIMAYEPNTYHSEGAVIVQTTVINSKG